MGLIFFAFALFFTIFIVTLPLSPKRLPPGIPRISRLRGESGWKTRWSYLTNCRRLFLDAHDFFLKNGKTCVLPSMGFRDEVHIPSQYTHWVASQPDDVLSAVEGFREIDKGDWNSGHSSYIQDPWQSIVIRKDMNRMLEHLITAMDDELKLAIPEYLQVNTEREVDVYEAMRWIVAQASSRFTVGLPLCRNKGYLKESLAFADLFILNSGLLIYTPLWLKPVVGFLITLPTRYRRWRIRHYIRPLYQERVQQIARSEKQWKPHHDTDNLELMIRYAMEKAPQRLTLSEVSDRLCLANLASFHQTAIAISNILINVASSNAEFNTVATLREEMTSVLSASDGVFNRAAAAKMIRTDSILRESMRTHAFGARAMIRKVVSPLGLQTPDGHVLPYGSTLSILAYPVHHDHQLYKDPGKFDPFRFSRIRTSVSPSSAGAGKEGTAQVDNTNVSFVSTSPLYLPFGHGKHACPGRFLVDVEMKMLLYHILSTYDIELLPSQNGVRPETKWVTEAVMPPTGVRLCFKRRNLRQDHETLW